MKRMKKVLALLMAVIMTVGVVNLPAKEVQAAEEVTLVLGADRKPSEYVYWIDFTGFSDAQLTSIPDATRGDAELIVNGEAKTIDKTKAAWYQFADTKGVTLFLDASYFGETGTKATWKDYVITIPKGSSIHGAATVAEDLTFSLSKGEVIEGNINEVSLVLGADRKPSDYAYWVDFTGFSDTQLTKIPDTTKEQATLVVDGVEKELSSSAGWYQFAGANSVTLMMDAGFFGEAGTKATWKDHVITIKKGTTIHGCPVKEDFTFSLSKGEVVEGNVNEVALILGADRKPSDYAYWIDFTGFSDVKLAAIPDTTKEQAVLIVDGVEKTPSASANWYQFAGANSVTLMMDAGFFGEAGTKATWKDHVITIKKGTTIHGYPVKEDFTFSLSKGEVVEGNIHALSLTVGADRKPSDYAYWIDFTGVTTSQAALIPDATRGDAELIVNGEAMAIDKAKAAWYQFGDTQDRVTLFLDAGYFGETGTKATWKDYEITIPAGSLVHGLPVKEEITFSLIKGEVVIKEEGPTYSDFALTWGSNNIASDGGKRYLLYPTGASADQISTMSGKFVAATIDGTTTDNAIQFYSDAGKLLLILNYATLETGVETAEGLQSAHEITIPAGTIVGDTNCRLTNEFTFYVDKTTVKEGKLPVYEDISLTWGTTNHKDDNSKRYTLYPTGLTAEQMKTVDRSYVNILVDGEEVTDGIQFYQSGTQMLLLVPYAKLQANVLTADDMDPHEITIPKGTIIGNTLCRMGSDFTFYVDRTSVGSGTVPEYSEFSLSWGPTGNGKQDGADTWSRRYMMTPLGATADQINVMDKKYATIYVDGTAVSDGVQFYKGADDGGNTVLWLFVRYEKIQSGITAAADMNAHNIKIKAGTPIGTCKLATDFDFYVNGETIAEGTNPPIMVSPSDVQITTAADASKLSLTFAGDILVGSVLTAMSGDDNGVYLVKTGTANAVKLENATLTCTAEGAYTLDLGQTASAGDKIVLRGTFATAIENYKALFMNVQFTYSTDGGSTGWTITEYIPLGSTGVDGDANSDHAFNAADLVRYLIFMKDTTTSVNVVDGDFNGTGFVDETDLDICKKMLLGVYTFSDGSNITPGKPTYDGTEVLSIGAFYGPRRIGPTWYNGELKSETKDVDYRTSAAEWQQYRDAGFNFVVSDDDANYDQNWTVTGPTTSTGYEGSDLQAYMNAAKNAGVDVVVSSSSLNRMLRGQETVSQSYLTGMVNALKNETNFKGFMMADEPTSAYLNNYKLVAEALKNQAPNAQLYTALLPSYGSETNYQNYLTSYGDTLGFLNYDFYPFLEKKWYGASPTNEGWFENLEMAANTGYGKYETGVTIQSMAHDGYRSVDETDISFQVYSALAYGNKTLTYYTYWMCSRQSDGNTYTQAMVDYPTSGTVSQKTELYDYVKNVNEEVRQLENVLMDFTWQGTTVVKKTSSNNLLTGVDEVYTSSRIASKSANRDAVIGCMKDSQGYDGFMIVNATNPANDNSTTVELTFNNADRAIVYVDGTASDVALTNGEYSVTVPAGEGVFVIPYVAG